MQVARPDLCQGMFQAQEIIVGNVGVWEVGGDFLVALLFSWSLSSGH